MAKSWLEEVAWDGYEPDPVIQKGDTFESIVIDWDTTKAFLEAPPEKCEVLDPMKIYEDEEE